jgi:hypothetical protein
MVSEFQWARMMACNGIPAAGACFQHDWVLRDPTA